MEQDDSAAMTSALRRPSRAATHILIGFVVGLLVAVVAIPRHQDTKPPGVAALTQPGNATGGTPTDAGSAAGTATTVAGTNSVTPNGSAASASPASRSAAGGATPSGGQTTAAPGSGGSARQAAAATGTDNSKLPNGGATATGVTATEVKIGVGSIDPSLLAPICPSCDPGPAKDGAPAEGLIAAWTRDGLLPVNGRTIKPVNRVIGLTPDQQRSACTFFSEEVKPFMVIAGAGTGGTGVCMASEHKTPVVDGYGGYKDSTLQQNYPLIHIVAPSGPRVFRNFVYWAEENGFLKGHTLGMYSYDDSVAAGQIGGDSFTNQASLTQYFRNTLAEKGYKLTVDFVANQGQEAAGVVRFKAASVDTAFVISGMHDFQQQAAQQNYHPAYPVADLNYTLGEAIASSSFDPDEMNGKIAMAVRMEPKSWAVRKPATPTPDMKTFTYCLKAYTDYTKRTLDAHDNASEISLVSDICSALEVTRAALAAAGPNLTVERFIAGLQTIKNMPTSEYPSVSFGPGRYSGSDNVATMQYNKDRWQPSNDLFKLISPWRPMWVP